MLQQHGDFNKTSYIYKFSEVYESKSSEVSSTSANGHDSRTFVSLKAIVVLWWRLMNWKQATENLYRAI